MANSDKNILITPSIGSTTVDPSIVFSGANASLGPQNITLKAYPLSNGTLSFEGSAGQLFSITNSLTGTIFSVNDVSGIPSIEVLDTGTVKIAQYSGNVGIGTSTPNTKLSVNGTITTTTLFAGNATINSTMNATSVYINTSTGGTGQFFIGNATVNTSISAATITLNGVNVNTAITGNATTAYTNATTYASNATNLTTGTLDTLRLPATANISTALNVGANVNLTTSLINVGNTTINSTMNATVHAINTSTGGTGQFFIGNATINSTMNATSHYINGTGALISLGNSTINTTANATTIAINTSTAGAGLISVGNTTVNTFINTTSIAVKSLFANSSNGTSGQVLTSNGTGIYWATAAGGVTLANDTANNATRYIIFANATSGSVTTAFTHSTGLLFNPSTGTLSATVFTSLSDINYKENFEPISNSLAIINKLNPLSFTWKDNGNKAFGVIAQEIEKVLPEIVEVVDGKKTVSYDQLVPILIQAVKDLQEEIKILKKK